MVVRGLLLLPLLVFFNYATLGDSNSPGETMPCAIPAPPRPPAAAATTAAASSSCRRYNAYNASSSDTLSVSFIATQDHGRVPRTLELQAAITSMLYFSTCRLDVHIFADTEMVQILQGNDAFPSLDDDFNVTIHQLPHKSAFFTAGLKDAFPHPSALFKASLELLAPSHLQRIVSVDLDFLWVDDICPLRAEFDKFDSSTVFGLVPEMSPWYVGHNRSSRAALIPANNTAHLSGLLGVNSGLILIRLDRARAMNWTTEWMKLIIETEHITMELGDQDVYNRMAARDISLFNFLPVLWNIQIVCGHQQCHRVDWSAAIGVHGGQSRFTNAYGPLTDIWALLSPHLLKCMRD
jgi:hypothetical protein